MNEKHWLTPLSDTELDDLHDQLQAVSNAMNIETLDGYMAALICCPDTLTQDVFLAHALGGGDAVSVDGHVSELLTLIQRRWNTIEKEFQASLTSYDVVYLPLLKQDTEGVAKGNNWAKGFLSGIQQTEDSWNALLAQLPRGPIAPILALAHEGDSNPPANFPPLTPTEREKVFALLIASLIVVYRHFQPLHKPDTLQ